MILLPQLSEECKKQEFPKNKTCIQEGKGSIGHWSNDQAVPRHWYLRANPHGVTKQRMASYVAD
jgi:hypothetical protein